MTAAYLPYAAHPSFEVGPVRIYAFGIVVAIAVFAGLRIFQRRIALSGLDETIGERLGWWVVIGGFLGAHIVSVLLYFPLEVLRDPLMILRIWENISSFGGLLGGALSVWLFFRLRAGHVEPAARWLYMDAAGFAFALALTIGRIACALAHDHPGSVTAFPLAISLDSPEAQNFIRAVYDEAGRLSPLPSDLAGLGFHDLGFYEFLYLAVVVVPVMLLIDRRPGSVGRMLPVFLVLYAPARFLLDFLRVSDVRYGWFTPAQWIIVAGAFALLLRAARLDQRARRSGVRDAGG